jgi:hypothetical protein
LVSDRRAEDEGSIGGEQAANPRDIRRRAAAPDGDAGDDPLQDSYQVSTTPRVD